MKVQELIINEQNMINAAGELDWSNVYNAPMIQITDSNHNHNERYYSKNDVDLRMTILETQITTLIDKLDGE